MIHGVSWSTFIYIICWSLFFYYGTIAWLFYRGDIRFLFSRPQQSKEQNLYSPLADALLTEVSAYCGQAAREEIPRYIFLQKLELILDKYEVLQSTPEIHSINSRIGFEVEKRCSILLTREELERLWKG